MFVIMLSPTPHREELLEVGSHCLSCAPTTAAAVVAWYSTYVVWSSIASDLLAQPHECSSKGATYHANNTVQAAHEEVMS